MTGVEEIDVTSEYKIKFLHAGHLEQVLCLQGIIAKTLVDPTIYYVEPAEFFCKQLAVEKSALGLFQKDQLLGFNMVTFPGLGEENLGGEFDLPNNELMKVAQIGPAAVHPEHRKNGILGHIAKRHIQVIKEMGYRHVYLTVAPTNYPTIKVFTNHGFVIKQLKLKYNNVLRYILHLDFDKELMQPQYSVRVPSSDLDSQKFIINLGFYGRKVIKDNNSFDIIFGYDEIKA
jgi:ribosomal protein S18 acetylase RimI-like enzyme